MEHGKDKITNVTMNPDKAKEMIGRHLVGGHPVEKYAKDHGKKTLSEEKDGYFEVVIE